MTRAERRRINRLNATHSTGPVSEEGKRASSQNALKHGLTSLTPYLPGEEQAYRSFAHQMMRELAPAGPAQQSLAQTWIDIQWRLKRIPSLEARLFAQLEDDPEADAVSIVRALDNLSRHENRLRKLAAQVKTELDQLQQSAAPGEEPGEWAAHDGQPFVSASHASRAQEHSSAGQAIHLASQALPAPLASF